MKSELETRPGDRRSSIAANHNEPRLPPAPSFFPPAPFLPSRFFFFSSSSTFRPPTQINAGVFTSHCPGISDGSVEIEMSHLKPSSRGLYSFPGCVDDLTDETFHSPALLAFVGYVDRINEALRIILYFPSCVPLLLYSQDEEKTQELLMVIRGLNRPLPGWLGVKVNWQSLTGNTTLTSMDSC